MNGHKAIPQGRPAQPESAEKPERELRVNVVYTGIKPTLAALETAAALAAGLRARIIVLVPQVVPFPAPLESASVPRGFLVRRLVAAARHSPIETQIRVCVCRDRRAALSAALSAHSLVVVGGGKHWWPTPEARLAAELSRQGHQVVFAGGN